MNYISSVLNDDTSSDVSGNISGNVSRDTDKLEVLVVDDDELTRKLIERLLTKQLDVKVKALSNGLEGLEYAQKNHPRLIILDIMLPGMEGFEVLKKLNDEELLGDTKVILVSAKSRSEDIERGFDLTADEYITKPFQPKEFLARVRRLIDVN